MKCPNCGKEVADDSKFCEICGKEINVVTYSKEEKKTSKKVNGWLICSIFLFILSLILGCLAYDYNEKLYCEYSYESQLESKINELESQLDQYSQTYQTKYNNQAVFSMNSDYTYTKRTDVYWPHKGSNTIIYTQYNGYGLSWWGWIPMNCLEKN